MSKNLLVLFLMGWLVTTPAFGQIREIMPIQLDQLEATEDPVFPGASAVLLYRHVYYEFGKLLEVREAIKIYNNDGLDYTEVRIPYEDIKLLSAKTYNLENGKIVTTNLDKKGKFVEEISKDREVIKLAFPQVRVGSIIEYSYKAKDLGLWTINYQYDIPIRRFRAKISNPLHFELSFSRNGYSPIELQTRQTGESLIYSGDDIPSLEYDHYLGSVNNYRGRLFIEPMIDRRRKKLRTWDDIASHLQRVGWPHPDSDDDYGPNFEDVLGDLNYFRPIAKGIVGNEADPLKKAKRIYAHLRDKMEWSGHSLEFTGTAKETYQSGYGSSGSINLLLVNLLNAVGVRARIALLSSKSQGFLHFVTRAHFDGIAAYANIGGKPYFLDASMNYGSFGQIPTRYINGDALILIDKQTGELVSTQATTKSNTYFMANVSVDPGELGVYGRINYRASGYYATRFRYDYQEEANTKYIDEIVSDYTNLTLKDLVIKDLDVPDYPISLHYDFRYDDHAEQIGNSLYINPLLFLPLAIEELKADNRIFPLDFRFPLGRNFVIEYSIPEGYKVASIPKSFNYVAQANLGTTSFDVRQNEDKINVSLNFNINKGLIPAQYYQSIKELVSKYRGIARERIVLEPVQ